MRNRTSVVVIVLFGLAALAGPIALIIGADRGAASFGDSESIGVNDLASATVELGVGSSTVPFSVERMAPGDALSGSVVVTNDGSVPLRYAIEAEKEDTGTEIDLLEVLIWEVKRSSSNGCGNADAPVLFRGEITAPSLVGNAAIGPDQGDRLLEPGASELLCVSVVLPLDVSDEYQAASGSVELILVGEHALEEP